MVVAVTTAVLVGPAVELGGVEAGTGCAAAQGGVQAGLVVDYGTVDGGPGVIAVECEELPAGSTGADLLVALGHELLAHHSGDGGRDFHRDLVGFEASDRFVGLHRIAGLLEPLSERRLRDRLAQRWNLDLGRHPIPRFLVGKINIIPLFA